MSKAFELAKEIVAAELLAEQMPKPTPPEPKPKTEVRKWRNKVVRGTFTLGEFQGQGKLVKLRIASPTDDFNVLVKLDGEAIIHDSYTNLAEELAAYEEDDVYYLHVEDKEFTRNLLVAVTPKAETTFTLLYLEVIK